MKKTDEIYSPEFWDTLNPNEPLVNPDVETKNLRRLGADMIIQGICDAQNKRKPLWTRLEALTWLTGDDVEIWKDAADYSTMDIFKLLTTGQIKRIRIRSKGKVKDD